MPLYLRASERDFSYSLSESRTEALRELPERRRKARLWRRRRQIVRARSCFNHFSYRLKNYSRTRVCSPEDLHALGPRQRPVSSPDRRRVGNTICSGIGQIGRDRLLRWGGLASPEILLLAVSAPLSSAGVLDNEACGTERSWRAVCPHELSSGRGVRTSCRIRLKGFETGQDEEILPSPINCTN